MRTISLCIPTFNRYEMTLKLVMRVVNDERISEIIVVDDCSIDDSFENLQTVFANLEKVKLYRNSVNKDCYANKHHSIELATNDFCALIDSDNTITKEYLDALYAIEEWDAKTIYQPQWARPHFSVREFAGLTLTKENIQDYLKYDNLTTSLNACNHFVNREEYLKVWDGSVNPHTSDSIFFCYSWLKAGNKIHITKGLEYDHYVDSTGKTGHYNENRKRTGNFHEELLQKFKTING